jgi:Arginase family
MALAMLTGRTPGLFGDALGLRPVAETSVVLADARDLDHAERDALIASQVRRVPANPAAITSALREIGRTPVYLHLDIDGIGSAHLPGLRFPSAPGPSLTQIEECLAAICATADVAAARIALRLATRPRQRPGHTRDDHPARPSTRHRPGMAPTRRPLTVQPAAPGPPARIAAAWQRTTGSLSA